MVGSTQWTAFGYAKPRPLRAPPPHSGWTTQFNGVYQVCTHCVLTQSTQLGCSRAWALASTQSHKLAQFMPVQKPYKCCNEGRGWTLPLRGTPRVYILAQGRAETPWIFFSKSALRIWWFHTFGSFSESCSFSCKWNRLCCKNASIALKRLKCWRQLETICLLYIPLDSQHKGRGTYRQNMTILLIISKRCCRPLAVHSSAKWTELRRPGRRYYWWTTFKEAQTLQRLWTDWPQCQKAQIQ